MQIVKGRIKLEMDSTTAIRDRISTFQLGMCENNERNLS